MKSGEWVSIFPASSEFKVIDDISVIDPNTIKFTLNEGVVTFGERFTLPIFPRHILDGQDLTKTDFWQNPIGTGPYKFVSWKKGDELMLEANPNFYGQAPKIGALKYIIVPDESARISLLKSGEVDAIKIDPRSMKTLDGAKGIKVYSEPSANWYALNLPSTIWPFETKEVRQAIAIAINKQQILDTIFNSQGEIAYGPFRKQDWVYNPDIAFNYDPERAKSLLADAGFKDLNGDGILEKDGKNLEFQLIYPSSNSERKDIAIAIKTDLAKIGIKVELVGKSWDEISFEVFRSNLIVMAWGSPFDPDDQNYQLWSSKFIGNGWWNSASYSNPEVDKLLEEGRTTFDKEKRKRIYQDLQTILADDQPVAFIAFCNYVYALNDGITGIVPRNAPHGQGNNGGITGELWWNVEDWNKE
jgi:peptide/nickel transport system substrate-binding protein